MYELTRLFDSHQATFVLKRSLLVTWDEAKLRNLMFIGSPAENPSLNAVPSMTDLHHDDKCRVFGIREPPSSSG